MTGRWLPRAALLLGMVMGPACSRREAPDEWAPGSPAELSGSWTFRVEREGQRPLVGRLDLRPRSVADSAALRPLGLDSVGAAGRLLVNSLGWFSPAAKGTTVWGRVGSNTRVFLVLMLGGDCGDCGNLSLIGRRKDATVVGEWEQESLGEGPRGRFDMNRR